MSTALALVPALYDRFDELAKIVGELEKLEGADCPAELRAAAEEELRIAISGTRDKIDRTAGVLASFEAMEKLADAEIERLTSRKERIARQRERLEGYVLSVILSAGFQKIEGFVSTLAARANPFSVVIDNPETIPAGLLRMPPPPGPAPDKALIKAALQRGTDVPGAPGAVDPPGAVVRRLLRALRSLLITAVVGFLLWALLTGLMVEDRGDYVRRARVWSRSIAVRGSGD